MRKADANHAVEKDILVNYTVTGSGIPELENRVKNQVTHYDVIKPS